MPAPTFAEQPLDTTVLNKLAAADVDEPTDVPGVMWSHVRPVTVVYGERSGLALDPVNVAEGRLRELRQMNNHHVYDYVPLAEIPKGQRIETARWLDDLNPAAEDPEAVRSRVDDQMARDECFQGTPPLKAVRVRRRRPGGTRGAGVEPAVVVAFEEGDASATAFRSTSSAVSVEPLTSIVETSRSCPGPGRARSLAQKGASAHFCFFFEGIEWKF